jgi:hypothetical protein
MAQAIIFKAADHAVYIRTHEPVGGVPSIHAGALDQQVDAFDRGAIASNRYVVQKVDRSLRTQCPSCRTDREAIT